MPLSYLYVYDLFFSIPSPSGGDVSAKVRKFFIPASNLENSFSRSAHPDLCRSLRSVPLSALRVQRYNISYFLQALSRKYFTKIPQVADLQHKKKHISPKVRPPVDQAQDPPPISAPLIPILGLSNTDIRVA